MRIAILSFFSGRNRRGVERWVYELSNRLSEKHEVVVYQTKALKTPTKYKVSMVGSSYREPSREFFWRLKKTFFLDYPSRKIACFAFRILPSLWRGNYDIIIPIDGGWEPAMLRILTWLRGKKMVIVGHAGIGWDDLNNLWCFPDCFVALSSFGRKWAKKFNPFVYVEQISDGVDLSKFKPQGKKIHTALKKPIVLSAGALTKTKRVDLTIKAVSKLKNVSLLVAGAGELKEQLSAFGKKLLGDRFKISKYRFGQMPAVYRTADVLASSSESSHSFEMVLIEAMASGLPVVANDDEIRKEIVGDAGILTDPEDIDNYSESIRETLSKKWGSKPQKQAEKYSWNEVVKRYQDLFSTLLGIN